MAAKKKSAAKKKEPELTPDETAQLGHFAEVVEGDHEGRYGVVVELNDAGDAILRSRDDEAERLLVPLRFLRPAESGRR